MIQFDEHIFQAGWTHQLGTFLFVLSVSVISYPPWNQVTVFLTAPREISIAAKSLNAQIVENATFPCDVFILIMMTYLGISNIQVRFQEITLGIEEPHCFALES